MTGLEVMHAMRTPSVRGGDSGPALARAPTLNTERWTATEAAPGHVMRRHDRGWLEVAG